MADLPYRIIIGLEVHVQLLTRTKLFCACGTKFGLPPNTATCPVCLGMPGALPVLNRAAFDLALRAAAALNCALAACTKWDRKNYYYPDLPKNYQISQYDLPLSAGGWLDIHTEAGPKRIGIVRAHLEEDAGKMLHAEQGGGPSLVDLNRTGTPLLEIVTQPELRGPEEARSFLEEMRLLLRELEISDCEMQEGSLRCDANINLHIPAEPGAAAYVATPIVEVKNLNSFRGVERAMKYEAERQWDDYQRTGQKLGEAAKATAGWDDARGITIIQRRKEEAADYRYFPDPDLAPATVTPEHERQVRARLGELPAALRQRLIGQYGLSPYDAGVLTSQGRALAGYFEETARLAGDAKAAANWVTNQVLQALNERKQAIAAFPLTAAALADLIAHAQRTGLNHQRAREVFQQMLTAGGTASEAAAALGFEVVSDEGQLLEIVRRAIAGNARAVADFKKGKLRAADAIKGAVMRETRGLAKMETVQRLIAQELEKSP